MHILADVDSSFGPYAIVVLAMVAVLLVLSIFARGRFSGRSSGAKTPAARSTPTTPVTPTLPATPVAPPSGEQSNTPAPRWNDTPDASDGGGASRPDAFG